MRPTCMRAHPRVLSAAALLLLAACGEQRVVDAPAVGAQETTGYEVVIAEPDFDDPAPVVLRLEDGASRELAPWTWCLGNGCADGGPPAYPFSVGSPDHVDFTFGIPGFDFTAVFREPTDDARRRPGRSVEAEVEKIGEHTFRVRPAGPPGTWHVDLSGWGDGDVHTTFAWTTTEVGTLPGAAIGTVAVLAESDGELDSYGVELSLSGLDPDTSVARAEVEVTSDNGRAITLDLGPAQEAHQAGALAWIRPARLGERAVALGGASFDYEVRVVLDGTTYTGRARWPEDTNDEITPAVPLVWSPALPVYDGR